MMKLYLPPDARSAALLWVSLLVLPLPVAAHDAGAAEAEVSRIPMTTFREYSHEVCFDLPASARVSYELTTPHPLHFDLHHHADDGTSYLIEHVVESADAGEVRAHDAGHYCFRVKNTLQPPAPFSAEIDYRVHPL